MIGDAKDEVLLDDRLRCILEGQDKGISAITSLSRAVLAQPALVFKVPPAPTGPAPVYKVTVPHAKGWRFRITERDSEGRIVEFTATPAT